MAAVGPKYERSAVDIISPMLTINQQMASKQQNDWRNTLEGVKGLTKGATDSYLWKKRSDEIEYKGDDYIAKLREQLADAESELTRVENSMRTIKAEDIGSLDKEWPEPTLHNAEMDVDTWGVDGGRTSSLNADTYDFQDNSNELGREFNLSLLRNEEQMERNEEQMAKYANSQDKWKNKYRMGGF